MPYEEMSTSEQREELEFAGTFSLPLPTYYLLHCKRMKTENKAILAFSSYPIHGRQMVTTLTWWVRPFRR